MGSWWSVELDETWRCAPHVYPMKAVRSRSSNGSIGSAARAPNQAVGSARLGVPVDLIGVVDRDAAGAAMVGEAAADGIDVGHRQSTPTTPIAASPSALVSEEDLDQIDPADHGSSSGQIDGTPEDGDSFFDVTD